MKFCSNEPSEAPCKSRRARLYVPGTRYGGNIIPPCEIPEMLLGEKRGSLFFDLAQRLLHGFLEIFVLGTAGEDEFAGDIAKLQETEIIKMFLLWRVCSKIFTPMTFWDWIVPCSDLDAMPSNLTS